MLCNDVFEVPGVDLVACIARCCDEVGDDLGDCAAIAVYYFLLRSLIAREYYNAMFRLDQLWRKASNRKKLLFRIKLFITFISRHRG